MLQLTKLNKYDDVMVEIDTDIVEQGLVVTDNHGWEWKIVVVDK